MCRHLSAPSHNRAIIIPGVVVEDPSVVEEGNIVPDRVLWLQRPLTECLTEGAVIGCGGSANNSILHPNV